jgi:hypothetical protein
MGIMLITLSTKFENGDICRKIFFVFYKIVIFQKKYWLKKKAMIFKIMYFPYLMNNKIIN